MYEIFELADTFLERCDLFNLCWKFIQSPLRFSNVHVSQSAHFPGPYQDLNPRSSLLIRRLLVTYRVQLCLM